MGKGLREGLATSCLFLLFWSVAGQDIPRINVLPASQFPGIAACQYPQQSDGFDSVIPSVGQSEVFYTVTQDLFSSDEVDIVMLNTSDCSLFSIPFTDFLEETNMTSSCEPSAASPAPAAAAVGGRRLQAAHLRPRPTSRTQRKALRAERLVVHHVGSHGRRLRQSDCESASAAAPDTGNASYAEIWPAASAPAVACDGTATPDDNSCDPDFLENLDQFDPVQSSVSPYYYFVIPALPSGNTGWCIASYDDCDFGCVDIQGFLQAASLSLPQLCAVVELAS